MRVFVTGGTGFVGPAIVRELLGRGHDVTLLVHKDPGPFTMEMPGVRRVEGDVTLRASFHDDVRGHDAVVHLVAIRREDKARGRTFEKLHVEATRNALEAAKDAGARRFLHMSASGVERRRTGYERTKAEAEDLVRASGLDWTIFRPTFVTGAPEGGAEGFDLEMAQMVRSAPVLPSFAGGKFPLQPVARGDVARAFSAALETPAAVGKTYFLAGPDRLTWDEYLRELQRLLGTGKPTAPMPSWVVLPVAGLLEGFQWFPASREELEMLFAGHAGDATEAERDLGIVWTPFRDALRDALAGEAVAAPAR